MPDEGEISEITLEAFASEGITARQKLSLLKDLHTRTTQVLFGPSTCSQCRNSWPCPTRVIIDHEPEQEQDA